MRTRKYMIAQFTFYDRTGIQRLLEEQAQKGWLLDKVSNFAWRFRRIEPKRIHFAVTYFPTASQFDPGPGDAQQELFAFCAHSGWVLVGTTAQIQIFYNERENPVPIETDPVIELENIHRSAKKNFLKANGLLLGLAILQLYLQFDQIRRFPLQQISAETTMFNCFCQMALLLITGQELTGYFLWYRRAKKAAENGEFVETKGHRKLQMFFLVCMIAGLLLMVITRSAQYGVSLLISIGMFAAIYAAVLGATSFMKRQGASAGTNRTVTIVLTMVLSFAITLGTGYALVRISRNPIWQDNRIVGTVEVNGYSFDLYGDEIPLKIEDVMEVSHPEYSYEANVQRSPLLKREQYAQRIWGPSELPDLNYIIYSTRIPAVYDLCVRETTTGVYGDHYEPVDADPWGAKLAYQMYYDREPSRHYVLCYDQKVVIFSPDWDMTAEQMERVGQILGK